MSMPETETDRAEGLAAQGPPPWSRTLRIVGLVAVLLTGLHLFILGLGIPALMMRPGWFWHLHDTELPLLAALGVPLALVIMGVGRSVWSSSRPGLRHHLVLVATAAGLSVGVAAMEGSGLGALGIRLERSGHSEFVKAALRRDRVSVEEILTDYEALVLRQRLAYASTKPPGVLLTYVGLERLINLGLPPAAEAERAARLKAVLTVLFPLLTALTLLPLGYLAVRLVPAPAAGAVGLLYLLAPNVLLVTMHLDGVLYPGLAVVLVAAAFRAWESGSPGWALWTGLLVFVATFLSFSLVPLAVLGLAPLVTSARTGPRRPVLFGLLAGALMPLGVLMLASGYSPMTRLERALAAHARFAGLKPVPADVSPLDLALTNLLDWVLWIGLPLSALWLLGSLRAIHLVLQRKSEVVDGLAVLLIALVPVLAASPGTIGETARLWLFLLPFVALVAARGLELVPAGRRGVVLSAVLILQALLVVFTKKYQDFW